MCTLGWMEEEGPIVERAGVDHRGKRLSRPKVWAVGVAVVVIASACGDTADTTGTAEPPVTDAPDVYV